MIGGNDVAIAHSQDGGAPEIKAVYVQNQRAGPVKGQIRHPGHSFFEKGQIVKDDSLKYMHVYDEVSQNG